jgi:hypothetical protein
MLTALLLLMTMVVMVGLIAAFLVAGIFLARPRK